ncbi:hypothetical protein Syun_026623 [Stephania yunnanensis]|uniref:Uncharacterized protein n=1 Tax=Stephania yunnanensis TaxID=152371 RepID=A0AAP0F0Y7_9MAGN
MVTFGGRCDNLYSITLFINGGSNAGPSIVSYRAQNHLFKSSSLANNPNFSSDQARILVHRTNSHLVSVRTCTKLCAISLLVGVVVGYTLKRRVKRWASKLLKRLKDD